MNNYCEEVYIISLHVTIIIRDYSILLGMFIVKGVRYFYSIGIMTMDFNFNCLVSVALALIVLETTVTHFRREQIDNKSGFPNKRLYNGYY